MAKTFMQMASEAMADVPAVTAEEAQQRLKDAGLPIEELRAE